MVVEDDDRKWEFTAERISVAMAGYGDELKCDQEGLAWSEEERRDGNMQKEEGQHGIEERSVAASRTDGAVAKLGTGASWPVREASRARIGTGGGRGDDNWAHN
mgnify:CR=1 FL=1